MSYSAEQIEYLHDKGLMPDWAWMQQNNKSPQENLEYTRNKIKKRIEVEEKRKKIKNKIEKQLLEAIVYTMEKGSEIVAEQTVNDIVSSINAALNGGSAPVKKNSFSADLGAMLGIALGQAPFQLLDELFNDEDLRQRK